MSALPADFWKPVPIKPAAALGDLRDIIMSQTEKRAPKWRFVLADDYSMLIQPKPSKHRHRFECRAVQALDPVKNGVLMKARKDIECAYWLLDFDISAEDSDWTVKPRYLGWKSSGAGYQPFLDLRTRILATFDAGRFDDLTADMMIGQQCMVCGKGLADPVSQARLVGPECFGRVGWVVHRRFGAVTHDSGELV